MKTRLRHALTALALTALLAGCAAEDPAAPKYGAIDYSFDTGPAGAGLTALFSPDLVVLYAVPPDANPTVVDYVIQPEKSKEVLYHVESASNANNFRLELQRTRLPKGVYHLKVYVNKQTTPFDERDVTMP